MNPEMFLLQDYRYHHHSFYHIAAAAVARIEYRVILKRGVWGPEHAVVSRENRDTIQANPSVLFDELQADMNHEREANLVRGDKPDVITVLPRLHGLDERVDCSGQRADFDDHTGHCTKDPREIP